MSKLIFRSLLALALSIPSLAGAAPAPGWRTVEIPTTHSFFWRYIPASLDTSRPVPLVLFFHGAGANPTSYRSFVEGAADAAGLVVVMPKSSGLGWGTSTDAQTVAEMLRLTRAELTVDDRRVAVAGHSAGGAYAYLLACSGSDYSAVFTLASPFYPVASLADPSYKPPVRMYYGTADPNYTGGAYANLKSQWNRLGVPWEEDVEPGYGHSTWPDASMADGFLFLAGKSRPAADTPPPPCVSTATALCLNNGRFRVEVSWEVKGQSGVGTVVPGASADSGLFWFFNADNWELMVKVLNGCARGGHYWVFAAATTDVHYVLTVTDTATGQVKRYENPAGRPSPATTDTTAFPTCP
ncbi:MAG TPA: alpha/beta fold hydrolase [Thermoanaerobaculia bacterium]|jgi:predicted esterase|nr:alpha/beta fold hydrolase [Thermoanaerobaculia bacterium]